MSPRRPAAPPPGESTLPCDPQAVADFLRALGHPMRLAILCRLLDGALAVGGFESELGLRQPSLSQQLGQLREAGLVEARRDGKSVVYSLADDRVRIMLAALHAAFGGPAPAAGRTPAKMAPTALPPAPRPAPEAPPRRHGGECGIFGVAGRPDR